jgi:hypothetical protein
MRAPHQIPSLAVVSERLNAAAQRELDAQIFTQYPARETR